MKKKRKRNYPARENNKKVTGTISISASGSGFLDREKEKTIYIPLQSLNTALNGDEVETIILPVFSEGKVQGEVVKVLKRKKKVFVGTIDKKPKDSFAFLVPDDSRMYTDIFIPKVSSEAKNGYKASVQIKEWTDPKKNPLGEIVEVIGRKGDMDAEMESIIIEKGFEKGFSDEAEKEASNLKKKSEAIFKKEAEKRKSFKNVPTFTIDPEDAKDFDDAISFRKLSDNLFEVAVHIADVSFWIEEKSLLDREARKRGFSLYLVDRTIPMLPEILSNDICSLNPNEDKLTFSVVLQITEDGILKKAEFLKTVINSDQRFSYEKAQKIIDEKKSPELESLLSLSQKLRKKRIENGALDISQEEIAIDIDQSGHPTNIYIKKPLATHHLIEEFMVLANREVASFLSKNKHLCLFRIHDKPDKDSIENLYRFLSKLGYHPEKKEKGVSSAELNNLLKSLKGKDEEFLVKSVLVRSLPKAIYSTENKGHFALALTDYAHFTSPIRRYADLLVHRSLAKKMKNMRTGKKESDFYKKTAEILNQREIDSASAERDSISRKQVEYMMERVGKTYKGIITGVTEWGIYVAELETKSEGMVRLRDMKDDYYTLDKENFSIVGTRNKKKYSLGSKVKIKVIGGDPDEKTLDYAFV